jgi:hypothetical protein
LAFITSTNAADCFEEQYNNDNDWCTGDASCKNDAETLNAIKDADEFLHKSLRVREVSFCVANIGNDRRILLNIRSIIKPLQNGAFVDDHTVGPMEMHGALYSELTD